MAHANYPRYEVLFLDDLGLADVRLRTGNLKEARDHAGARGTVFDRVTGTYRNASRDLRLERYEVLSRDSSGSLHSLYLDDRELAIAVAKNYRKCLAEETHSVWDRQKGEFVLPP